MTPSLLPDLGHLPTMISTFIAALLSIGLGGLAGARRAETALVAGWGIAAFATVAVGTLTPLSLEPVMLTLGVAGFLGVVWLARDAWRGVPRLHCATAARTLLLALPLVILTEGMETTGWDDFSHWLPNLAYLCGHGHFPTLAEPGMSYHAGYPAALALPGYTGCLLLGRIPENAALIWNLLVMIAAAASIATILQTRLAGLAATPAARAYAPWAAAALGLLFAGLACPSFVAKIFFSNMADASTAAVLTVIASLLFAWLREPDPMAQARLAWLFALCGVALIDLRQENLAQLLLLFIGAGFATFWHRARPGVIVGWMAVLAFAAPLLTWVLWRRYTAAEIPSGDIPLLPFFQWHWAEFPSTLASMARVMLAKTGLFVLIAAITVRAALALRRRDTLTPAERGTLLGVVTVCLGNIVFLACAYLAVGFSKEEAAAAASFWRYIGETGPLAVLAAAVALPLGWTARIPARPATVALAGLAAVLPIATVKFYRFDLDSPVPTLRRIGEAIDRQLSPGQPVELVDVAGDGFAPLVVGYQLRIADARPGVPPRPVAIVASPHGVALSQATSAEHAAPYLWLAQGAPEVGPLVDQPLHTDCAYLLKRERDRFAVVGRWPLGPAVARAVGGGRQAIDAPCQ